MKAPKKPKKPKKPRKPRRSVKTTAAAIRSLSDADYLRLEGVARCLMEAQRWVGLTQEHGDLLHEATKRILEGKRVQPKKVDLPRHYFGTMKSIANSWVKSRIRAGKHETHSSGMADAEASTQDIDRVVSLDADPERIARAKEMVKQVRVQFANDMIVIGIFNCWALGMTGPETCRALQITALDYDAARNRIKRWVKLQVGGAND